MTKVIRTLWLAAIFLPAMLVQAQSDACPVDPVTGIAVAQMISPANGSTLQPNPATGAIDFAWCNASADYFVIIESVPGAHDIFFAFTGGAGGGAGQNFLNLGPACAPSPPIGCIPAQGETIYFTLETVKNKQILGSFQYTYTAPSPQVPPAATTTAVANQSVTASSSDQTLTLTATVAAASTVNQGTVTFQVMNGTTNIGSAVTSGALTNGSASVGYSLPGGTPANTYTVQASYSGGANFVASSGSGTLAVNPAPPVAVASTTTVDPQSVVFNSAAQNVTLTATIAAASAVNEGTVTFQVKDGANDVGTAVVSATVSNGSASAIYALPAGLAAATYSIQAAYSGGSNFQPSSGNASLIVNAAPPPTATATATTVANNAVTFSQGLQQVTLTAAVSVPGGVVNEGTVTFQVMNGATTVGTPVPSATLTNGSSTVSYALPAGTAAGTYTVQATYSGGANFLASSSTGSLTVNKAPSTTDFTSVAPASLPFHGTYTPTATSTGDGTLTLAVSGACSISAGVVTITAGSGTCTVTATESQGTNFLGSSATPQTIAARVANIPDDFQMAASVPSLTIKRGQSGSLQITLTPSNGFDGTVTFSCTGLPSTVNCQFTPAQFAGSLDGKPLTTSLAISASQVVALNHGDPASRYQGRPGALLAFWGLGAGAIGMVLAGGGQSRQRTLWSKRRSRLLLGGGLLLALLAGCGGGPPPASPQTMTAVVKASFVGGSQPASSPTQQVQVQITVVP